MKMALALAQRGLGRVAPNPAVGCVIVDAAGHVAGRGWTAPGGRPHAETIALKAAKGRGHTAYVTLEPCAHYGKTPPCANALVDAGIRRVVVATTDPDARVNGKGIKILEQAGVQTDVGLCRQEADELNEGFFRAVCEKRPLVTLKIATSKDGKTAHPSGKPKWITGPESRARGHLYRANHDAIMVAIGTVLADNPSLDCRLAGLEGRSPQPIVMDSHLRLPADNRLADPWVMTVGEKPDTIQVPADETGRVDIRAALTILAEKGITRLLVEGGSKLNASLIRASLVDRLLWFRAPEIIGPDGLDAIEGVDLNSLSLTEIGAGVTGCDSWQEFKLDS